jgi:hypothetical protein
MFLEELMQWPAMVEGEDGMGADKLLDEKGRWTDFS